MNKTLWIQSGLINAHKHSKSSDLLLEVVVACYGVVSVQEVCCAAYRASSHTSHLHDSCCCVTSVQTAEKVLDSACLTQYLFAVMLSGKDCELPPCVLVFLVKVKNAVTAMLHLSETVHTSLMTYHVRCEDIFVNMQDSFLSHVSFRESLSLSCQNSSLQLSFIQFTERIPTIIV